MSRAFILLLDSFGIGASIDAVNYGDQGANTLGHIAEQCLLGNADKSGVREGPLQLPHLTYLGLNAAATASSGCPVAGLEVLSQFTGAYGYAVERSLGKDTPSGHWELMGVPVMFQWGYFPPDYPSFPADLIEALIVRGNLPGVLGNKHASGTEIIDLLGEEHIKTGKPIVYTSADSVFQIAAHEDHFGLERLYQICEIARELVDPLNIGRVIARPFLGAPGHFYRTGNRRDLSIPPPELTLLDNVVTSGGAVIAIGKVGDIFAHQGVTKVLKADGNKAIFDTLLSCVNTAGDKSVIFANFVDFDMVYGHRRDVVGYAAALEAFDKRLPEFERLLQPGDIAVIVADHGCDPTWPGSDHTREHIPVLVFGPGVLPKFIGRRDTFADVGQTLAQHLGLNPLKNGISFLRKISKEPSSNLSS